MWWCPSWRQDTFCGVSRLCCKTSFKSEPGFKIPCQLPALVRLLCLFTWQILTYGHFLLWVYIATTHLKAKQHLLFCVLFRVCLAVRILEASRQYICLTSDLFALFPPLPSKKAEGPCNPSINACGTTHGCCPRVIPSMWRFSSFLLHRGSLNAVCASRVKPKICQAKLVCGLDNLNSIPVSILHRMYWCLQTWKEFAFWVRQWEPNSDVNLSSLILEGVWVGVFYTFFRLPSSQECITLT